MSDDEIELITNCYTKQGRAIKTRIRPILQKNKVPYSKLDILLKQIANFVENNSAEYEKLAKTVTDNFVNMNAEMRNKQRLFCLAESPFIDSMWAYYSDESRGFCVEYDFNKGQCLHTDIKRVLLNLFKVKYRQKRRAFSFIDMLEELIINGKQNRDNIIKINRQIFEQVLTKNLDWRHEKEWRIIVSTNFNKLFADLVSAIYIDDAMITDEKGQKLVTLAIDRKWSIYCRKLNATKCEFKYNKLTM